MQKYKIVITDSGLGGLDVAAKLYEKLIKDKNAAPVEIIFVNALPETNHGYNKLPDPDSKASVFNKVLFGINKFYSPDIIGIACNTLSAIAHLTEYYKSFSNHLVNIIDIGVSRFIDSRPWFKNSNILIFGTETTIDSSEYQNRLSKYGAEEDSIIAQRCPNLASEIERSFQSKKTDSIIQECVSSALSNIKQKNKKMYCILGCTHYGYAGNQFKNYLTQAGIADIELINPNDYLVDDILSRIDLLPPEKNKEENARPSIEIISKCKILPEEIESISKLLNSVSPQTISALQSYKLEEKLF